VGLRGSLSAPPPPKPRGLSRLHCVISAVLCSLVTGVVLTNFMHAIAIMSLKTKENDPKSAQTSKS
jgi:hypothetical protein